MEKKVKEMKRRKERRNKEEEKKGWMEGRKG